MLSGQVLGYLITDRCGIYVDCTAGEGGHSEKIIASLGNSGKLIGIDRDASALESAKKRFKDTANFLQVNDNFSNITNILRGMDITLIDGALFDLGVSSLQLESPERGFSFMSEGPLDMRMDRNSRLKASTLVNNLPYDELADIIWKYGEERQSRRIARAIIRERDNKPIETTSRLAEVVERAVRYRGRIHPATRTFQALRIAVNNELENLETGISEAAAALKPGGRICVISFHSLEDRIVKNWFRSSPALEALTKKPVTADEQERAQNPRSRSAKLRAAVKRQCPVTSNQCPA